MQFPNLPTGPIDDLRTRKNKYDYYVDKLTVHHLYLWNFAVVCNGASKGYQPVEWWYIDAMAGPGVNEGPGDLRLAGSPLIAQQVGALPKAAPAAGLVFAESSRAKVKALKERVGNDPRVKIIAKDVNAAAAEVLAPVPRNRPTVAFFDPEGFDVSWTTLAQFAKHRTGRRKMELFVMLPTHVGMLRTLFLDRDPPDWSPRNWDRVFGPLDWISIYQQRRAGQLDGHTAAMQLVELYRDGFRSELGYQHVHRRKVPATGSIRYWLIFATDDETGEKIMNAVMNKAYSSGQSPLFPELYR